MAGRSGRSGRSGNGLRCLEPGQNFRKFNSDHFPFFKNLNPTSGSKVSVAGRSGRSGNGLRCLEPCQKFRKFNSDHFPFFKNLYRTSGSRVSLAGNWVWTIWKRSEVSGTRPEIFFAPFGRGLRVNGGWRETYFWDVCSIVL